MSTEIKALSLSFFQEQICSIIDTDEPIEILSRIETHVLDFLIQICIHSSSHHFEIVSNNTTFNDLCKIKTDSNNGFDAIREIKLGKKKKRRAFQNEASVRSYSQLWLIISRMHQLIIFRKHVSQRELFYMLINHFDDQSQINRSIQDVISILKCPRESLGVYASSRGWIAGSLLWNEGNGWIDCSSMGNTAVPIPGILPKNLKVQSKARYIIVVEKDGVFKRLVEDRFFKTIPCIIITACGFPDHSTRKLLYHLYKWLSIPVLALVDYNPFGLSILLTYKLGAFSSLESYKYCIDNVKWLGLHSIDVESLHLKGQTFNKDDIATLNRIENYSFIKDNKNYLKEVGYMRAVQRKVELQSLNNLGYNFMSSKYLKRKILKQAFF